MSWAQILCVTLLAAGLFFQLVAALGLIRFPDVYCRLHVVGINDTLGAPLILLAAAVWLGASLPALKIVLAIVFLYLSSPLVSHLLSWAAVEAGHLQEPGSGKEGP
jgi:multicomponent Na+:H+ antiporter subunit G